MNGVRLRFLALAVLLLVPVGLLIQRTLESLEFERRARHDAVAERVIDEMERGLSKLLETEEARPFADYRVAPESGAVQVSGPVEGFVLAHFQVDPDGGLRGGAGTPLSRLIGSRWRVAQKPIAKRSPFKYEVVAPGSTAGLLERASKARPGGQSDDAAGSRVDAYEALQSLNRAAEQRKQRAPRVTEETFARRPAPSQDLIVRTELTPMAGELLDGEHLMLYRTVLQNQRGYRQGLLIRTSALTEWLSERAVGDEALRPAIRLTFSSASAPDESRADASRFVFRHRFAEPFDALGLTLALRPLPGLGGASYVYSLAGLLLVVGVLGLYALYRMVAVAMRFAERRSNFAAAVSHELKTPLTAIRMYAEMLRDGMVESEDKRHEYYEAMTFESERLSRLINNVLEFSRLEKGKRQVVLETASLAELLRQAQKLLSAHVAAQEATLEIELADDLPTSDFDRDAVLQILFNLVDNALKYAVDPAVPETQRIVLAAHPAASGVVLSVRDFGPGVAARELGRIFEPFYRSGDELTRTTKGTGIGLALVASLAQSCGARVEAHDASPGLRVEICFPASSRRV